MTGERRVLGIFTLSLGSIRPGDPANVDTPEEVRGFLSSIEKGDPGSGRVVTETAAQVLKAFIGKWDRVLRKGWCCQNRYILAEFVRAFEGQSRVSDIV